jgi:hypothetical protein
MSQLWLKQSSLEHMFRVQGWLFRVQRWP